MRVVIVRMRRLLVWCRWPWSCRGRWGPSRLGHRSFLPRPGAFPGRQHVSGGLRGRRSWGLFSWGQHLQWAVSPWLRAPVVVVVLGREHTVYTRAVEDLAGFTRRAGAIALDLGLRLAGWKAETGSELLPFASDNSCSSWPLWARWRRGGRVVGRCQSEVWPLRRPVRILRWTWRRDRAVDQKHSLAVVDQVDGGQDAGKRERARP
jgi:hypothetical protein